VETLLCPPLPCLSYLFMANMLFTCSYSMAPGSTFASRQRSSEARESYCKSSIPSRMTLTTLRRCSTSRINHPSRLLLSTNICIRARQQGRQALCNKGRLRPSDSRRHESENSDCRRLLAEIRGGRLQVFFRQKLFPRRRHSKLWGHSPIYAPAGPHHTCISTRASG